MKKAILIILGILIVAGVSFGIVYLWQKNIVEKEVQRIYKNQKWGFQFQYPANYTLDTTYESQGYIHLYDNATYEAIKQGKIIEGAPTIQFSAYDNPDKLSALEWAQKNTGQSNFSGEYKTIQVDNKNAMSYSWIGMGGGDTILLVSDDLKYIYSFDVMYINENNRIKSDFLQIVKTIKF